MENCKDVIEPDPDIQIDCRQAIVKDIDLTCLICTQSLHHPRVLDCLHTFCEECVVNNISKVEHEQEKKYFIKCVRCSEVTEIPGDDVSMLPYNFFASNAMDYLLIQCTKDNVLICNGCQDKNVAVSRCVECSEFLCVTCVTAHRRIKVTKEHKIIDLDILRYDKTSIHRPVYCPDHEPEMFTYFCEVCQELICKECTILEHRGHKYERLSEALERKKPNILRLLEENEKIKVPPIDRAVDEVQDMAARLHARTVATKQAVKNCTAQCIRAIEFRCHELLASIDNIYKEKSRVLHEQQTFLQLRLMKNKSATNFVSYAFNNGSEAETFELLEVMKTRLKGLNQEKLDYKEPYENDVIEHVYDIEAVTNIANNLGDISTSKAFLAHTKVHGPGLLTAKVGIETLFIIEVFDKEGKRCIETTHDDSIRVKVQAPEGFYINNKVTNNKDGSYAVRYTPVTKGKHNISIKIRGRNFPNNQYVVRVYDGIDYLKIESPYISFGTFGGKTTELRHPWGVAVDEHGHLLISDYGNHRVVVCDQFGVFLSEFGSKGSKDGQFLGPTGIAVDQTGIIAVADWDNHRVQLFSPTGSFIGKFGEKGDEKGQLFHPAGIAIDRNSNLAVVERDNHRIQVFSLDGNTNNMFGSLGSGKEEFNSPTHIAIREEDNSYFIADSGNNRLVCLASGGAFIQEMGEKGNDLGHFDRPSGIAIDKEGYVIVGDFQNHRIQVFTREGKYFTSFGKEGEEEIQFKHPSGLAMTNEGRVAVADRYNHRIQVF